MDKTFKIILQTFDNKEKLIQLYDLNKITRIPRVGEKIVMGEDGIKYTVFDVLHDYSREEEVTVWCR